MPEIPEAAITSAAEAIMVAQNANDDEPERFEARLLARVALEAAEPILAEARGVASKERRQTAPFARVACPQCGAVAGENCYAVAPRTPGPRMRYSPAKSHGARVDAWRASRVSGT